MDGRACAASKSIRIRAPASPTGAEFDEPDSVSERDPDDSPGERPSLPGARVPCRAGARRSLGHVRPLLPVRRSCPPAAARYPAGARASAAAMGRVRRIPARDARPRSRCMCRSRHGGRATPAISVIMLLEMWAYVLDVVGFYDARIADESYLRSRCCRSRRSGWSGCSATARSRPSQRRDLAALADGADPVVLPAGTAFRSEAFGDQPPQVFETGVATTIWPQRNSWRLAPIRGDV